MLICFSIASPSITLLVVSLCGLPLTTENIKITANKNGNLEYSKLIPCANDFVLLYPFV